MAIPNCSQLASEVANAETNTYPPVLELCLQLLELAPSFSGGFVYTDSYDGAAPGFTPPSGAAIAIDYNTRRQWQWAANEWT